ncbi:phosphoglycerate dehydrogenase [Lactococcus hircilactis]|uniref:D-3-phosphoglycerate dehydrogenase n=1 Tax=Lactococcus hircilactis TaxID=1494462 RepID=A0A7X1Z8V1_9LACT|nr:3-phosphoglycerate dehydrogenase family protein [Lactococcus hircilactis]MQW39873.1 phosphoglycerate dehydrogenase [Lactococcus hircilactis]
MVYQIKTIGNNIDQKGLSELGDQFAIDQVTEEKAHAFLCRAQNFHTYKFSENLLAIGRAGAGFNNIPVEQCSSQGIVVFNAPGGNANAVKELVLAMMIFGSRNLKPANKWLSEQLGSDQAIDLAVEKGKKAFSGSEIAGKTIGIIGLGNIGSRVANDAEKLGMKVIGYDPYIAVERAWEISSHVKRVTQLSDIFEQADYITIHTPLTKETRGMYGAENFAKMKKGVVVLNFARDEITDKDAVLEYINNGTIQHFATDFGSEKFYHQDAIFVTPHLGGSTAEASLNCTRMAANSLKRYLMTGEIINSVNFPRVVQELNSPYRITLINKNVPNVVANIAALVSEQSINIANIVNRGQGEFAYTLLDLDESNADKIDALVDQFKANENIVRVRVIQR